MRRMTIKEAAKKLDLPEQSIRSWAQTGRCPFVEIVAEPKSKHGRRTYYVNSARLELYLQGKL